MEVNTSGILSQNIIVNICTVCNDLEYILRIRPIAYDLMGYGMFWQSLFRLAGDLHGNPIVQAYTKVVKLCIEEKKCSLRIKVII